MNKGSWALPGLVTFVEEIFQRCCLCGWGLPACPPVNWGYHSRRPRWDTLPPPPATSSHSVRAGNPSATSSTLPARDSRAHSDSSFELWAPSPPTQLSPYPQLSTQVHPTHHPSNCHPSTSSFLTNWHPFLPGFKPTWGGPDCVVRSPAPWMATPGLEVKQAFRKGVRSPHLWAALFLPPPRAGKSASALTSILPMPLLAVSFSLDWWSFLSIAPVTGRPGGAGAVVPCGCLGREAKQQVVFLAQGMMPREERRKV